MKEVVKKSESKSSLSKSDSFSSQSGYESDYSYESDIEESAKAEDDKSVSELIEQAQNMNLAIARSLVDNNAKEPKSSDKSNLGEENTHDQQPPRRSVASKAGNWVKTILNNNNSKSNEPGRGL